MESPWRVEETGEVTAEDVEAVVNDVEMVVSDLNRLWGAYREGANVGHLLVEAAIRVEHETAGLSDLFRELRTRC